MSPDRQVPRDETHSSTAARTLALVHESKAADGAARGLERARARADTHAGLDHGIGTVVKPLFIHATRVRRENVTFPHDLTPSARCRHR